MKRWLVIALAVVAALAAMSLTRTGVLVSTRASLEVVREGDLIVPYDGKPHSGDSKPFTAAACTYWIGLSVHTEPLFTIPMSDTLPSDCPRFILSGHFQ